MGEAVDAFEGASPDWMPLVGPIPGAPHACVIGCVGGGYTIGPWMGTLLAQRILGQEPAMPRFDPARVVVPDLAPDGARAPSSRPDPAFA